jgi:hypothetical protein
MVGSAVREETKRPVAKEADLYSWARRQAELLRPSRLSEIDAAAIAEEIDDVGEEQYDELESALRVLMFHVAQMGPSALHAKPLVDPDHPSATTARRAAVAKKSGTKTPGRRGTGGCL